MHGRLQIFFSDGRIFTVNLKSHLHLLAIRLWLCNAYVYSRQHGMAHLYRRSHGMQSPHACWAEIFGSRRSSRFLAPRTIAACIGDHTFMIRYWQSLGPVHTSQCTRTDGDSCHQGGDQTQKLPQNVRLPKYTEDITNHWETLEEHFLMVPLAVRFNHFRGESVFSELFQKTSHYEQQMSENYC
jgi:hypothetical protein